MEWRVLLVLLFAVSFTCALPDGKLDADLLLEDREITDLEDPLEEDSEITGQEASLEEDSEISDLEEDVAYRYYKVDGAWSPWSPYTKCSKTCGGGLRSRSRTCTNPKPANGGKRCQGSSKQTKPCNTKRCKVDGAWSPWSPYTKCSKTCGGGSQSRSRTCTNPKPANGGKRCQGSSKQTKPCNTKRCKVDGAWSPWSPYTKCSKTCGGGSQSRSRTCTNPKPANGGKRCQGSSKQTKPCNTKRCKVDGAWSPWSPYTKCSKTCGGGLRSRGRTCTNPKPTNGGKRCQGSSKQTMPCNTQRCKVDGAWSPWSPYTKCSKTCGGGLRSQSRTCTNPKPANGGKRCQGSSKQTKPCNTQRCKVDGAWSPWSPYTKCSKKCGGGLRSRSRTCTNPKPAYGGKRCQGSSKQTKPCNTQRCKVDGAWSPWSPYTKCSKTCGGGLRSRSRTCTNPKPANGGKRCQGSSKQTMPCNTQRCKVDGAWSPWSPYTKCSKTCGGGLRSRSRTCTNPKPANGGKRCQGSSKQTMPCNTQRCKVDGAWSPWSPYTKCSKTCGGGSRSRSRTCTNPKPANGGKRCQGSSKQTMLCNTQRCKGPYY